MTIDIDVIELYVDAQELEEQINNPRYDALINTNPYAIKHTTVASKSLENKLSALQKTYCEKMKEMLEDAKDPPEITQEVIDDCDKESLDAIIRGTKLVLEHLDRLWDYYVKCGGPKKGKDAVKKALQADHNYAKKRMDSLAAEVS